MLGAAALAIALALLAARLTATMDCPGGIARLLGCAPTSSGPQDGPKGPSSTPTGTATTATRSYPTRASTGVPQGVSLKARGPLTIDVAGTVVDGLDIRGPLTINADDVLVRRSRVTASAYSVINVKEGSRGVRIEDVEVDGMGLAGLAGSAGIKGPVTVLRARIHGVENGIVPYQGSVIEDSMISDLAAPGNPHIDGIEINGGSDILIKGNLVDLTGWGQTSAVMIDNYFAPISRIRVEGNRLLGGGYTVYSDGRFKGGPISDVSFQDNRLGKGQWGYASISQSQPEWSGNVDDLTGATIPR